MKDLERFREDLRSIVESNEKIETICQMVIRLADKEEEERRENQKAGINRAKNKGVAFGRPRIKEPDNFGKICSCYFQGEISAVTAAAACGMGVSTFYRRVRDMDSRIRGRGEK